MGKPQGYILVIKNTGACIEEIFCYFVALKLKTMTDFNQNVDQAKDLLNLEQKDMQKLPTMLNVLTILTYIGCALGAIGALYNYFTVTAAYKLMEGISSGTSGTDSGSNLVQSVVSQSIEIAK